MKKKGSREDLIAQRLGRKIARLRAKANMSGQTLGDAVGLSQGTISEIEWGTRRVRAEELGLFAQAFDITTAELLDGVGYPGESADVTGTGKARAGGSGSAEIG